MPVANEMLKALMGNLTGYQPPNTAPLTGGGGGKSSFQQLGRHSPYGGKTARCAHLENQLETLRDEAARASGSDSAWYTQKILDLQEELFDCEQKQRIMEHRGYNGA